MSHRLGHSSVSITLHIYAHVIPYQGVDAARVLGDVLYANG